MKGLLAAAVRARARLARYGEIKRAVVIGISGLTGRQIAFDQLTQCRQAGMVFSQHNEAAACRQLVAQFGQHACGTRHSSQAMDDDQIECGGDLRHGCMLQIQTQCCIHVLARGFQKAKSVVNTQPVAVGMGQFVALRQIPCTAADFQDASGCWQRLEKA